MAAASPDLSAMSLGELYAAVATQKAKIRDLKAAGKTNVSAQPVIM